jgi:para-nitrobenzyl esterase
MQKPGGSPRASGISEDCLTLNIWAPANSAQNKLPVMVFVYGGSFINGSGSLPLYDGEALARKNVVLVTFNYRTGVFGFLAHRLLTQDSSHNSSGNYGLMDIVAALKWVKENIAVFGGDPGRVTLRRAAGATRSTTRRDHLISARACMQRCMRGSAARYGEKSRRA